MAGKYVPACNWVRNKYDGKLIDGKSRVRRILGLLSPSLSPKLGLLGKAFWSPWTWWCPGKVFLALRSNDWAAALQTWKPKKTRHLFPQLSTRHRRERTGLTKKCMCLDTDFNVQKTSLFHREIFASFRRLFVQITHEATVSFLSWAWADVDTLPSITC